MLNSGPIYRSRPPTRLAFDISRIVIDAGVLLVLGALSLPFVTAEGFQQRSLAGDGLVALFLVAPVFVMTLIPDHSRPLPRPLAWGAVALASAALPYAVIKYLDASTLAGTVGGGVGMGVRVLVMGAAVALAGALLGLIRLRFGPTAPAPGAADSFPSEAVAPSAPPPASRRAAVPGAQAVTDQPATTSRRAAAPSARPAPAETPARPFPRWKRPGTARRPSPAPPPGPSPTPAAGGRLVREDPVPRPTDADAAPTLPAQGVVHAWWLDDLDDLFS